MRTNQDQIFDDDIDYKSYVKNLLRFSNSNTAREMIDKIQGVLLYRVAENSETK